MDFLLDALGEAADFLRESSGDLGAVVGLTLLVSGIATVVAVVLGVPLGITLGLGRFRGRQVLLTLVNVGMGIPPVLVGLVVLMILWSDGPLGSLDILFTPAAMVIVPVRSVEMSLLFAAAPERVRCRGPPGASASSSDGSRLIWNQRSSGSSGSTASTNGWSG